MESITIQITDELIAVVQGRTKGARLAFIAAGLQIWKIGQSDYHHVDCVGNLAMQACEARHIPIVSLRQVFHSSPIKMVIITSTKTMFGEE